MHIVTNLKSEPPAFPPPYFRNELKMKIRGRGLVFHGFVFYFFIGHIGHWGLVLNKHIKEEHPNIIPNLFSLD